MGGDAARQEEGLCIGLNLSVAASVVRRRHRRAGHIRCGGDQLPGKPQAKKHI